MIASVVDKCLTQHIPPYINTIAYYLKQLEYDYNIIFRGGGYRRYKGQIDRYHIACTVDLHMNYNYYLKENTPIINKIVLNK